MGRIFADGSVQGSVHIRGTGAVRLVSLPAGTVKVQPDSICASARGMMFSPCYTVNQIDSRSFRGAISGLGFAYCDFVRRTPRIDLAESPTQPRPVTEPSTRVLDSGRCAPRSPNRLTSIQFCRIAPGCDPPNRIALPISLRLRATGQEPTSGAPAPSTGACTVARGGNSRRW